MVKRNAKGNDQEPEQKKFEIPSEKEHLFQVTDVLEDIDPDPDIVHAKLEVVGGEEAGRTTLNRLSLDDKWKGFFATRLFLKAVCEPYKGEEFPLDTDNWIGRQFYATVVHNAHKDKTYANIDKFNFEKMVEQTAPSAQPPAAGEAVDPAAVAWDD